MCIRDRGPQTRTRERFEKFRELILIGIPVSRAARETGTPIPTAYTWSQRISTPLNDDEMQLDEEEEAA